MIPSLLSSSKAPNVARVIALFLSGVFGALFPVAPVQAQRSRPVSFTATITPAPVHPGETVTLTVTATIKEPYHIYSVVPPKAAGPQPTELTVEAKGLTTVGGATESAPKQEFDKNFNLPLGLHEKTATFTQLLKVGSEMAGSIPLTVSVRYMACNATQCLPPTTIDVAVPPLSVEAGAARPEFVDLKPVAAPVAAATQETTDDNILQHKGETGSLGTFVLTAFGAGLLALITPCVFPMIPVTFAFFTKEVTKKGGSVVKLASVYCLGIILTFTGIGAVLAATVGAAGANRLAANPWVNLVFAILFVMFGLALLELVEIRPPAALQKLSGSRPQAGGTLGVLFMGLTFVIAAFTCTAPFIGTVLVAASTASSGADWIRPILGMTAFASALALPFFLLALFPGLLAKLPKSGAWLSTVKGTMGFLELAAALKFLSNSDLVWQWQVLTQPVMLALWTVLALAGAFWLLGILHLGFSTPEGTPTVARRVWAGVFVAGAVYFLIGMTGRPLNAWLVAFLPPAEYGYRAGDATASSAVAVADELPFLDNLDAALAQAKAENKPIFIDFTGYTCTNCRWMEKNVFPVGPVKAEMENFVRVRLYTDGGKDGQKNQEYQEKTFGDVALPLYAVLRPDGKPVAKSTGITQEPEKFADFLRMGRENKVATTQR